MGEAGAEEKKAGVSLFAHHLLCTLVDVSVDESVDE